MRGLKGEEENESYCNKGFGKPLKNGFGLSHFSLAVGNRAFWFHCKLFEEWYNFGLEVDFLMALSFYLYYSLRIGDFSAKISDHRKENFKIFLYIIWNYWKTQFIFSPEKYSYASD